MSSPRRRFLRSLSAVPLLPTTLVGPQPVAPPRPSPSPETTETDRVAEALTEAVKRRYGSQLEAADLEEIQKGIVSNLKAADRLRNHMKLSNADEPVTVFEARPRATRPQKRRKR